MGPEPLAANALPPIGAAAVTMGVFDGVHPGHRALLVATSTAAVEAAGETAGERLASVALVFTPHPEEVLRPGRVVPRLAAPATTLDWIREAGIDYPLPVRFDEHLRRLTPEQFLDALAPAVQTRVLVMTPSSAFGRDRSGTPERMREVGAERGFEVHMVDPVEIDGEAVSSSRIRHALARRDLRMAGELLGRPPIAEGVVVHGDGRGRPLGFPTANLSSPYPPALPPNGIYRGRATIAERGIGPGHPALVSIGVRPTFGGGRRLVEVYLLDFDGDLYDAWLRAELLDHLRDEERFDSVEALVAQMRRDEVEARRRFSDEVDGKRAVSSDLTI